MKRLLSRLLSGLCRQPSSEVELQPIVIDSSVQEVRLAKEPQKVLPAKDFAQDVQEISISQLEIINRYYEDVLRQAQQSFISALVAAAVGLLFFIAAVTFFLIFQQPGAISILSFASGVLIEFISGVNFYLYKRASDQLAHFHASLDRMQRYLYANSVCENLEGELKQETRAELVHIIAGLPSEEIEG